MTRTNTTTPTNSTQDSRAAFSALLTAYAREAYSKGHIYPQALENLATAVAYSVLKKCIDTSLKSSNDIGSPSPTYLPSHYKTLVSIRRELARDKKNIENIVRCGNNATKLAHNGNGALIEKTIDNDCKKALDLLVAETLGDGLDLVNEAVIAILDETEKQLLRGEEIDLEKPYTVRRLNKKVWIKSENSVNGWETVETTPIREIYKAVRRAINASRAMATDPRNGYSYIEDLATDTETGETATIYRRLTKYADLGGYATDFNGAFTCYTVDSESVTECDELIESLGLSKRQAQILKLRQSGYGYKAIATYLGIRADSVRDTCKAIQQKAKKNACFNPLIIEKYINK